MRFTSRRVLVALIALMAVGCSPMMGGQPEQPDMNVTGTLTRTQTTDGSAGSYYLSGMMGMSYALDVSKVASPAQYLGKQVAVTGKMDTTSGGSATPKIIVSKIEIMEGAPPPAN